MRVLDCKSLHFLKDYIAFAILLITKETAEHNFWSFFSSVPQLYQFKHGTILVATSHYFTVLCEKFRSRTTRLSDFLPSFFLASQR